MERLKKQVYLGFVVIMLVASLAFVSNFTGVGQATHVFQSCNPGSYSCVGETLRFCQDGFWINTERCDRGCRDGACIAGEDCTPGTYRCLLNYRQQCVGGVWKNIERCYSECINGMCDMGSKCDTGTFRCNANYLQECREGRWYNSVRCLKGCSGDTCKEFSDVAECTDTDGKDYTQRGFVTGIDRYNKPFSYSDECKSGDLLDEYVCEGNNVKKYTKTCIVCEEGACKSFEESSEIEVPYGYSADELPFKPEVSEIIYEEPMEEEPMRIVLDNDETVFSRIRLWFKNLF